MALIDPETCSWCTDEVEDSTLIEIPETLGSDCARICPRCADTQGLNIEFSLLNEIDRFFR